MPAFAKDGGALFRPYRRGGACDMVSRMTDNELQLPASCRGRYPFRLGTTSFIIPDDYLPNVRRLAPWFDEIELLFFEAGPDDPGLVSALAQVRQELGVGYNVHLPVDLSLCDESPVVRRQAAARMARIIRSFAPLEASTATLHLGLPQGQRGLTALRCWQDHAREAMGRILEFSRLDGRKISIETLDYPLAWLEAVIEDLDLGVCLDFGHLALAGVDWTSSYRRWAPRCDILHLHAAAGGRDHQPLDCLSPEDGEVVREILSVFTGTVSLEVFSLPALQRSVGWMVQSGLEASVVNGQDPHPDKERCAWRSEPISR